MLAAAVTGFATSLTLILAIGAQNAFVLRAGLSGRHVPALVLFCGASDAVLITAGILGFGALVAYWPAFPVAMGLAGAAFLLVYGAQRMRAALRGGQALMPAEGKAGRGATLAAAAAVTWLNPHVYLDTLGLIGAISTQYPGTAKAAFGVGAVAASFSFFAVLGFGARLLAPIMRTPRAWRLLDGAIAVVMWAIAAGLLRDAVHG